MSARAQLDECMNYSLEPRTMAIVAAAEHARRIDAAGERRLRRSVRKHH